MKAKMILAIRVCLILLCCGALPGFAQEPGSAKPARGGPTPSPVLDGSAKLSEHYNPNQMLRLVFGLKPPHQDAEKKFLQELQDRPPKLPAFPEAGRTERSLCPVKKGRAIRRGLGGLDP